MESTKSLIGIVSAIILSQWMAFSAGAADKTESNVILLTLDGVRWQEVFHGVDEQLSQGKPLGTKTIFPFLTGTLTKQGMLIGDRQGGDEVTVANPWLNSLPAYQSIMAGSAQPCRSNACGQIGVETLPERLAKVIGGNRRNFATIASWEKISDAAEHVPGTTFVNAGMRALDDGRSDSELEALNKAQQEDTPPWGNARFDKYTFQHAMRYLKLHKPRFLFISLDDSDEWGHKNNYPNYVSTLRQYDQWIEKLVSTLDEMGDYGKATTLIVMTDHGRGDGEDWKEHGSGYPSSKFTWFYIRSPKTITASSASGGRSLASIRRPFSHADIRPTIEALFELPDLPQRSEGRPITEVLSKP